MTTTKQMTAPEFLHAVFSATPRTSIERLLYAECGLGLGAKPWWPPLIEVWLRGPSPPREWTAGGRDAIWREAHEFLAVLHADFEQARRANAKRKSKS